MSELLEQAVPEQDDAKRLLAAALAEPAHAYLFHGPPGVGKRDIAVAFAAELLGGDPGRALRRAHPDLYVLEPLGDQIRIDPIRELRRDLHMRPFEADRRVYLIFSAHAMNEDAADALLKDLEEPPDYAIVVLVAEELGPLPETILSRCQLVPFRRLSERAVRAEVERRAPELGEARRAPWPAWPRAGSTGSSGCSTRPPRLGGRRSSTRRARVYLDTDFDPSAAAAAVLAGARERAAEARAEMETRLEGLDLPAREAEQQLRRAARGAEREQLLLALEELAAWYRDLVVVGAGAPDAAMHADRMDELREDATPARQRGRRARRGADPRPLAVLEEFNLQAEPHARRALHRAAPGHGGRRAGAASNKPRPHARVPHLCAWHRRAGKRQARGHLSRAWHWSCPDRPWPSGHLYSCLALVVARAYMAMRAACFVPGTGQRPDVGHGLQVPVRSDLRSFLTEVRRTLTNR